MHAAKLSSRRAEPSAATTLQAANAPSGPSSGICSAASRPARRAITTHTASATSVSWLSVIDNARPRTSAVSSAVRATGNQSAPDYEAGLPGNLFASRNVIYRGP